jgi:hypothetical protein
MKDITTTKKKYRTPIKHLPQPLENIHYVEKYITDEEVQLNGNLSNAYVNRIKRDHLEGYVYIWKNNKHSWVQLMARKKIVVECAGTTSAGDTYYYIKKINHEPTNSI